MLKTNACKATLNPKAQRKIFDDEFTIAMKKNNHQTTTNKNNYQVKCHYRNVEKNKLLGRLAKQIAKR